MTRKNETRGPPAREERPTAPSYLPLLYYLLGFAVAAEVGVGVYFGVTTIISEEVHWLKGIILPATAAVVISTVIFVGYHMAFKAAGYAETMNERLAAAGAAFGVMLSTILVSGWFWASLLGGATAISMHRAEFMNDLQKTAMLVRANCELDSGVVLTLRQGAANILRSSGLEKKGGDVSGDGPGNGSGTKQLEKFSEAFGTAAIAGQSIVADCNTALSDLRALMDSMRRASDPIVFERLAVAATDQLAKAASAKVSTAGLSVGTISEKVADFTRKTTEDVEAVISRANSQRAVIDEIPTYRPMKPAEAVTAYAQHVLAAWLVPLSFQVIPYLCLLLLLAQPRRLKSDAREATEEQDSQNNIVEFAPSHRPLITPAE
jgi:hypothetical protein